MSNHLNHRRGGPSRRHEKSRAPIKKTKAIELAMAQLIERVKKRLEAEAKKKEFDRLPSWRKMIVTFSHYRASLVSKRRYTAALRRYREEFLGWKGVTEPCPHCKKLGHANCDPEYGAVPTERQPRTWHAFGRGAWRAKGYNTVKRYITIPGVPGPSEAGKAFLAEHGPRLVLFIELQAATAGTEERFVLPRIRQRSTNANDWADSIIDQYLAITELELTRRDRRWLLYELSFLV